jgi:hypothetical protein
MTGGADAEGCDARGRLELVAFTDLLIATSRRRDIGIHETCRPFAPREPVDRSPRACRSVVTALRNAVARLQRPAPPSTRPTNSSARGKRAPPAGGTRVALLGRQSAHHSRARCPMSPTAEALCCAPALVLWLGPAAALALYGVSRVWGRLARR